MEDPARKADILVVEDDDNIATALNVVLSREGYSFARLATGAGAVDVIRESKPDLVLLNVLLPDVSGYEICQRLRADPDCAGVRILVIMARGSPMERRKGLALGADGLISKPFDLDQLRAELRRLLHAKPGDARLEGDVDA